jgi:pimeloyl-ACP methyl ester carboxylesterase
MERMERAEASDPELRHVDVDGLRVAHTDEGRGPTIVAVHGLPGSVRDYRWLGGALRAGSQPVRLVRVNLAGFGEGEGPAPAWSELGARLAAAAEAVAGGPHVLVAHSFAAPIALAATALAPASLRGLALLAPVGLRPHQMYRRLPPRPILTAALRGRLTRPPLVHLFRAAMRRTGFPHSLTAATVGRTLDLLASFEFDWAIESARRVHLPVFGAWTLDDSFVEPAVVIELLDALPPGPRQGFPDGGHNLQKTRARELAAALAPWAAERVAG